MLCHLPTCRNVVSFVDLDRRAKIGEHDLVARTGEIAFGARRSFEAERIYAEVQVALDIVADGAADINYGHRRKGPVDRSAYYRYSPHQFVPH